MVIISIVNLVLPAYIMNRKVPWRKTSVKYGFSHPSIFGCLRSSNYLCSPAKAIQAEGFWVPDFKLDMERLYSLIAFRLSLDKSSAPQGHFFQGIYPSE